MEQVPRTEDLVLDFLKFCVERPYLRFWQALNAWSNNAYIYVSKKPIDNKDLEDTYYLTNLKVIERKENNDNKTIS